MSATSKLAILVGGGLEHAGALLQVQENLFVSADEPAYTLRAGAAGAEVLLLRYPPRDPAYAAH